MKNEFAAVILAAGQSKRFKSRISKIFHLLLGKPIIEYVVDACREAGASPIVVVASPRDQAALGQLLGADVHIVVQDPPLGTGHAVQQVEPLLGGYPGDLCVVVGDCPLLTAEFLTQLHAYHRQGHYAATLTSTVFESPPPFGRVIRDEQGNVVAIVEEKDATPEQRQIKEVNTSHYCFQAPLLFPYLKKLKNDNVQGEYYLTDVIGLLVADGHPVGAYLEPNSMMLMGINTRRELQQVSEYLNRLHIQHLLDSGITVTDPATTIIEVDVQVGRDTLIHPFVYLGRGTRIGEDCEIGPFVYLKNCTIPDRTRVGPMLKDYQKMQEKWKK